MSRLHHRPKPKKASTGSELLIKNLRLLDLDDEFDWPKIEVNTFAATGTIQAQIERVRSGEWVLCKLFELWDPEAAKQSLQDLFPALEPRQSLALRVALFKELTELKRNGIFSKDIVVRKTMLDDCKGPKFEELLAVLSTLVLRKLLVRDAVDSSIARHHILGDVQLDREVVFPLSLAYQASCSAKLRQRQAYERRWQKFSRILKSKKDELTQRTLLLEEAEISLTKRKIPQRTLRRLRRLLDANWTGNIDWIDVLLRSDKHRPKNLLLERSFENVWNHACNDTLYAIRPERNDSLLQNFQGRVNAQNLRLVKWRSIQERLMIETEAMTSGPCQDSGAREVHEDQLPAASNVVQGSQNSSPLISKHARSPSSFSMDAKSFTDDSLSFIHPHPQPYPPNYSRQSTSHSERQDVVFNNGTAQGPDLSQAGLNKIAATEKPEESCTTIGEQDELAAEIVSSVMNAGPSPFKYHPSLAERTRFSMAKSSPLKVELNVQDVSKSKETSPEKDHSPKSLQTHSPPRTPDHYSTLAERTRQSMSLMSTRSKPQPRKSRASRLSAAYPVNQFALPSKFEPTYEQANSSILEEGLEAMHEDEEAIFKSRPKIAQSPPPTPLPGETEDIAQEQWG